MTLPDSRSPCIGRTMRGPNALGAAPSNDTTDPVESLLARLDGVRQTGTDQWMARCPAHEDRRPSLSIKRETDRALVYCFGGCETGAVLAVVGLTMADLFVQSLGHNVPPLTTHQRRRHGQAREALKALEHEARVVSILAEQMSAGFNLDPGELLRLKQAMRRIAVASELAG